MVYRCRCLDRFSFSANHARKCVCNTSGGKEGKEGGDLPH